MWKKKKIQHLVYCTVWDDITKDKGKKKLNSKFEEPDLLTDGVGRITSDLTFALPLFSMYLAQILPCQIFADPAPSSRDTSRFQRHFRLKPLSLINLLWQFSQANSFQSELLILRMQEVLGCFLFSLTLIQSWVVASFKSMVDLLVCQAGGVWFAWTAFSFFVLLHTACYIYTCIHMPKTTHTFIMTHTHT